MRTPLLLIPVLALASGCEIKQRPPADPCNPNPCTGSDKTRCEAIEGEAVCLCNAGFVTRPSGACEPVSESNCPSHAGDPAEPDDCQARAKELQPGSGVFNQSIDPIGDYDFFWFSGKAREVVVATVKPTGGALAPRIDLFDQTGTALAFAEGFGDVQLAAKLYGSGTYAFRVTHSPLDPSVATGNYAVSLESTGPEDHGDSPDDASTIYDDTSGSPSTRGGRFEFPGDQDWYRFSGSTSRNYRVAFDSGSAAPIVSLWLEGELNAPHWTVQQQIIDFDVPRSGDAYLSIQAADGKTGSYAYSFTSTSK